MPNMVNDMKYNIGDIVYIPSKHIDGEIVDIVNTNQYRISTKNGLILSPESMIELVSNEYKEINESTVYEGKLMKYAKDFFKKMKLRKNLNESLRQSDLEYLVSPYVSIDQYTSKLSEDNITIAFFCNERDVAKDLSDFLEKLYVMEIRDIEVSESLTEDNKYILYVEFDRNQQFPKILVDILDSINFLINKDIDDWDFKSFNMEEKQKVSVDKIRQYVRLSPIVDSDNNKNDKVEETVEYKLNNISRKYLDEGYMSLDDFDKVLETSDIDMGLSLDKDVLEYNFPNSTIIMTETHAYIVNDDVKKLRML